jgi:xylan 1,4-beta-xylosidase
MVEQFVRHLVNRYGINELSQWYFEVWNEPDYAFPEEFPKEETYFMLYDHTARDVKRVDSRLRVGGPATANATWITAFLDHCQQQRVPVDFVSTHMYGDENGQLVLHTKSDVPRNRMVCAAVEKVHKEIEGSTEPKLPFILSEFNASWMNIPDVLDTVYMGPWLADTIRQCDGMVDQMSFWSFSDVFEEEGVVKKPFYGGFGLIAEDSIPKPAFNAFALLHKLGDTRLISNSESSLVTRRKDGTIVIALWNFVPASTDHPTVVESKTFEVELQNVPSDAKAYVSRLDADNGNVLKAFDAMGKPSFPTQEQIKALQVAAQLPPAQAMKIERGGVRIDIPARGLALLEIHSKGGEE